MGRLAKASAGKTNGLRDFWQRKCIDTLSVALGPFSQNRIIQDFSAII
jgi:hypothetical protein